MHTKFNFELEIQLEPKFCKFELRSNLKYLEGKNWKTSYHPLEQPSIALIHMLWHQFEGNVGLIISVHMMCSCDIVEHVKTETL